MIPRYSTTLLFPFVTCGHGYDTLIYIANTSKDHLGTRQTAGSVTLTFYSNELNPLSTTKGVIAPGEHYKKVLSNISGHFLQNAFVGYMIAQCNFEHAYGFAYIFEPSQPPELPSELRSIPVPGSVGYLAVQIERGKVGPAPGTGHPIDLFVSYSHKDKLLREKLGTHLAALEKQGLVRSWHDRKIGPGREWEKQINQKLNDAHLILLLISADFLNSAYCYGLEMTQALNRHDNGEARVIPIILRPVTGKSLPSAAY